MSWRAGVSSCPAASRTLSRDEAERQLLNWERNLAVEYDESDLVIDDDERDVKNGRK